MFRALRPFARDKFTIERQQRPVPLVLVAIAERPGTRLLFCAMPARALPGSRRSTRTTPFPIQGGQES